MTQSEFKKHLSKSEPMELRAYFAAKLLRQAKPDDVFMYLSVQDIAELWANMLPYLGKKRDFWNWFLDVQEHQGNVRR